MKGTAMILAVDGFGGIGKDGEIPWNIPEDLKRFREITMQYDRMIMGRKTWDSLPEKPLDGRVNVVVTSSLDTAYRVKHEGADDAIGSFPDLQDGDIVIGGKALYEYYVDKVDTVYLTQVAGSFDCDVFVSHECHYMIRTAKNVQCESRHYGATKYKFEEFDMREERQGDTRKPCEGWCPAMGLCNCIKPVNPLLVEAALELTEGVEVDLDEPIYSQGDDTVDNPFHYNQGSIETIDIIKSATVGYEGVKAICAGNVIKYISRAPHKGSKSEDLLKAQWYLNRLIEEGENDC